MWGFDAIIDKHLIIWMQIFMTCIYLTVIKCSYFYILFLNHQIVSLYCQCDVINFWIILLNAHFICPHYSTHYHVSHTLWQILSEHKRVQIAILNLFVTA